MVQRRRRSVSRELGLSCIHVGKTDCPEFSEKGSEDSLWELCSSGDFVMETEALWTKRHVPLRNKSLVCFSLLLFFIFLYIVIAQEMG